MAQTASVNDLRNSAGTPVQVRCPDGRIVGVGDLITTAEEYESLPIGSIIAGDNGCPWVLSTPLGTTEPQWMIEDRIEPLSALADIPGRVLRVGWNWGFLEGDGQEDEIERFRRLAHYDWVHVSDDDFNHLHSVHEIISDHEFDAAANIVTGCGLTTVGEIPGLSSRLGLPRCPGCCATAAIPEGNGSPKNDPECARTLGLENT